MKIVAGLSGVDAYQPSCEAGADELFCGYVPEDWAQRYGLALPLNRREVRYVNVQLGAYSELCLLAEQVARHGVPVTLTFNSLHYTPAQYPVLGEIMCRCMAEGFRSFIIADMALLQWLHAQGLAQQMHLQVSGEVGEVNRGVTALCRSLGAERIILHRKVALADMAALIRADCAAHPDAPLAFEAFALNELCHFHGGYCQSLHCDELAHLCRVPYRLGGVEAAQTPIPAVDWMAPEDCVGRTGCGLCALYRLAAIGVTHVKLVGRGNVPQETVRDIAALRRALTLAQAAAGEAAYLDALRREIFPRGCGRNCYYFGETGSLMK